MEGFVMLLVHGLFNDEVDWLSVLVVVVVIKERLTHDVLESFVLVRLFFN